MVNLTSRKLAALICGLVAVVVIVGFSAFKGGFDMDKALLAVSTLTLAGIGAQTMLDSRRNGSDS